MKAKLLKKVRKQYEIRRIERLSSNPSELYEWGKAKFGLPFYVALDKYDDSLFNFDVIKISNNLNECKAAILNTVIEKYREKFRHISEKSTKVWP